MVANNEGLVEPTQLFEQEVFESDYLSRLMRIPIVGRIVANAPVPIPASDFNYYDEEMSILVGEILIPLSYERRQLFALEVDGDSMVDAMVNDGDIVILRSLLKNEEIRNGEMAAIWFPSRDESTLKYYYKEKEGFRLQPANPTMAPILVSKDEPLEVKGIVVMVIRKVGAT